jgi:transcriptional regulator with XRE-family HTH domain
MLNKNIGKKLFEIRKNNNWSQEQTADYIGVSRSVYQRIETGDGYSWASNLEKICEVFQIQPEELVNQDALIINHNQSGGNGYVNVLNQLSDTLKEQYEARLRDKESIIEIKDEIIKELKQKNNQ